MFASKEKRHLLEGPRPGATPGGVGLVDVMARTDGSSEDLLDRCREVLEEILDAGPALWPSVDEWRSSLPQWFVRGCADEPAAEDDARWLAWWRGLDPPARQQASRDRPWSLADWLWWMQPDERTWFWWNARRANEHEVQIHLEVPGWPSPTGALVAAAGGRCEGGRMAGGDNLSGAAPTGCRRSAVASTSVVSA